MDRIEARSVCLSELRDLELKGELTGLFYVSDEDYHSGPGVSASGIVDYMRSPAHYKAAKNGAKKTTPAMAFGTQVHEFVLQGDRFDSRYLVEPEGIDGPRNRQPWKGQWDAFKGLCEADGKIPIERSDWLKIKGIALALAAHDAAASLLADATAFELAGYVQDKETGIVRRAKADLVVPWGVADLKTTQDARLEPFLRTIRNFHYHTKAAWYLDVFSELGCPFTSSFVWIAVETEPPHGIACYLASERMLDLGRETYKKALSAYENSVKNSAWPAYSTDYQTIEFAEYVYTQETMRDEY